MFEKIGDRLTVSRKVEQQIQNAIISGSYSPGEKLPTEMELSESFGVSRNTLREALKSLESKGLIEVKKGCGMFISEFSLQSATSNVNIFLEINTQTRESLLQIIKLRLMFEPRIVAEACINRDKKDLAAIGENIRQLEQCPENALEREALIDNHFHKLICQSTHNMILQLIMDPVYNLIPKFVAAVYGKKQGLKQVTLKHHLLIFRAVEQQDQEQASGLMKNHIKQTQRTFSLYYQLKDQR